MNNILKCIFSSQLFFLIEKFRKIPKIFIYENFNYIMENQIKEKLE